MEEIWRTVIHNGVVYEGYEVSTEGRVRSLNHYGIKGKVQVMKPQPHTRGYLQVGLRKNGKYKTFTIHSLVAYTFIPNPNGLPEINHINENKHDNRVENLEWCDREQNILHGTWVEKHSIKVRCVETGQTFISASEAGRKTGLQASKITGCCRGRCKTCGKYHWQYYKDYLIDINDRNELLVALG